VSCVLHDVSLTDPERHHHVALQPRLDPPRSLPSRLDGQRPRRVARQAGCQANARCW
jgi:hypothetical protein